MPLNDTEVKGWRFVTADDAEALRQAIRSCANEHGFVMVSANDLIEMVIKSRDQSKELQQLRRQIDGGWS